MYCYGLSKCLIIHIVCIMQRLLHNFHSHLRYQNALNISVAQNMFSNERVFV